MSLEDDRVVVDAERYVQSQPVSIDQVIDVLQVIRVQGVPVRAQIDVTGLRISRVDIIGVVRIIWELHIETFEENLLASLELKGASPKVLYLWNRLRCLMPPFLSLLMIECQP